MDDEDFIAAMSEGIPPISPPIRGSRIDEYEEYVADEIADAQDRETDPEFAFTYGGQNG